MNSTTNSSTSTTPATSQHWCGWCRHGPRQVWQLLVSAASEAEARELLHQRCAALRNVDTYVALATVDPNR